MWMDECMPAEFAEFVLCEADPDESSDSDDEVEKEDDYDIDEFELYF